MKSRIVFTVCLLAQTSIPVVYAGDSPWEPSERPMTTYSSKIPKATDVEALSKVLDEAFEKFYKPSFDAVPDLYFRARAQIAGATPVIAKGATKPQAKECFSLCSLVTLGAVTQLVQAQSDRDLLALEAKRIAALEEIKSLHEKINELERSKASEMAGRLKADIRAMQEEADKKFKELQSSLIQVTNDARGTIISMSDILFETGKANLTADLKTSLAKIAGILLVFRNSRVIVEGHTDNVGSEEYNQGLSEKRAENVMSFLIEQGVSPSRLRSVGYGLTRPVADNETSEGRAKNRRVDLIVQEKKAAEEQ